jgi:PHD/YefM family antitoxin component YafN of YafNO toxin-antitoxin module
MTEPNILGVREILSNFRGTVQMARETGEPVVIALRRRKPAAVLLGYETWQALALRQTGQADTAAWQAELAAESQRNGKLTAELAAARRQVEEVSRDLAAERQRVTELAAQLARPQTASQTWGQSGAGWSSAPPSERLTETWAGQSWGSSGAQELPAQSGWGQS